MQILLILSLIIAIVAVVFAVSNTDSASVSFLGFDLYNGSLALILILSMLVGVVISMLASTPSIVRNKWTVRKLNKKLVEMEKTLNEQAVKLSETEMQLQERTAELEVARTGEPGDKDLKAPAESAKLETTDTPSPA